MTIDTQDVDADLSAPVVLENEKLEVDTPDATAAAGEVEKKQDESAKKFKPIESQEDFDAAIQKRLLKKEREVLRNVQREQAELTQRARTEQAPDRDNFQDDHAYINAQIEHRAAVLASERLIEREQAAEAEKRSENFIEKAEKASERYADFQQVVGNRSLRINEAMAEYIGDSDMGADVAYHLGKNPAQASQIADLSPIKAARELARIEGELAARPKAKPSNAPEPISPVGTRGKASTSSIPSDDDDIATWMRKEQARMRGK